MDPFRSQAGGSTGSATGAFHITPDDGTELAIWPRAIGVAASGTVTVDTMEGQQSVPIYVAAGVMFPLRVTRVRATGTTATGIVGYY